MSVDDAEIREAYEIEGIAEPFHRLTPIQPSESGYDEEQLTALRADAAQIIARYPHKRSALLPLLHLVQSVDGYVTGRGVTFCAEQLELTDAEVTGVATFYTQYKRHPNGEYTVGVCTNTLCAVMGGDLIFERLSEHLGIGSDETTEDGKITLERVECNAACDYAPVVMANWEFMDNQTPESTIDFVEDLRAGKPVRPSRGPNAICTFKQVSRVLAGFNDGLADQGVGAGAASLAGLELVRADERESGQNTGATQGSADTSDEAADTSGMQPGRHSSQDTPANDPDTLPQSSGGEAQQTKDEE
ncbi:NADH-quinone oxidoreductase subunit NuoE [Branchiibius sp. NY16-3462-2]|uniref:NADH-quinone oxidoreductase subunit NuoE n=1 Tax=Branchiibius sp. NY16-3462-2 TaxID=1807500 RepID=UPI000B2D2225|nr:NADH-quinone oxidoreductase subunit NuoE [Branchiibius sp. NY16-3462-2]